MWNTEDLKMIPKTCQINDIISDRNIDMEYVTYIVKKNGKEREKLKD